MKSKAKFVILCAVVICLAGVLRTIGSQRDLRKLTYSQFLERVQAGQVASVIVIGSSSGATQVTCRLKDGNTVRTVLPSDYRDAIGFDNLAWPTSLTLFGSFRSLDLAHP